jgi:putative ubiquitin-RnfH superfamily antitoxin RatB of RatAB toxin-antitoxin module
MALPADIGIEVTYAEPHRAIVKAYRLSLPATIDDALRLAAADPDFAGIDFAGSAVGIFGRVSALSRALADGDRVEIYRPLTADPKTARRARAREARKNPRPR